MSFRNIVLIAAALLITAGTSFVARSWLANQRAKPVIVAQQVQAEGIKVLVAKAELPTGVFIQEEQLRWQLWPNDDIPDEYFTDDEIEPDAFFGAVVRRGFTAGEPITPRRVIRPGERGFLAAVLRPGYRAIAIRVDATSGVSGLVFPGDRIDIILTHTLSDRTGENVVQRRASETVLQNVRVLALDQTTDDNGTDPQYAKNFTLEVTPKQTEMLSVVRELGALSISLRSLAKDEEELERLTVMNETKEESDPERGDTYTWDSEVSRLVGRGSGNDDGKKVVNVTRGNEVQELRF
ncbi:Flp pilus assembly protein CpaB [Pelagibius litoralis]|uniref:Flp pilus assembly protein CpaB n=1 Tax=Pelagibius litoralis TaxID=374515 RepID=A0A967C4M4_9PROT|nr:Flp pilus assembly protein CpaB [Pelagibius litoralis]NIA67211.1 Flp pilus assembly protein CpaB [Pelagibius litoralis]